jgi:DNA-3-methyladenine glycosylase II
LAQSCLAVEVAPPFRLDLTVWALRRRPINRIDRWDGTTYRRTLFAGDTPVELAVTQVARGDRPRLRVVAAGARPSACRRLANTVLAPVLGLAIDLMPFYRIAARDPRLNELAERFRGMRPPRFPTVFEALVNGVACQQLSLEAGLTLLNRLADAYGQTPRSPPGSGAAFPRPCDLARASPESLRALGFSRSKSAAIIELASAVKRQDVRLDELGSLDDNALQASLDRLRGVGRWTAEYVLLRGYGRLGVFPADDVGARNGLQRWLGLRRPLDYERTRKILGHWRPYGGLVYLHLLLKSLDEKGLIPALKERA